MFPLFKHATFVLALALPVTANAADYTYQQTTQVTGGSLLHMVKSVGIFSSQARHMGDPQVSTIYLKDNRLANVSPDSIEIIDLDKETITQVDVQKKTYTVMTFDQIKQAMENARARMAKQQPSPAATAQPATDPNVKMSFDVKVRKTGAQKQISGLDSSEAILTMTMTATSTDAAQQQPQSGAMAVTNDMWMVPAIPGYDQVRDFHRRMAEKMADATRALGYDFSKMLAQNPGASSALGDMAKEMQKLDGVPIMQIMRMGTTINGQPLPAASEAPTPAAPAGPTKGEMAKAGLSSAISSRLGGFGGFGKKKQQAPPPDQDAAQTPDAAQAQAAASILMETQITTSNFSSAPVDPSHFDVPAGYKQVQSQIEKSQAQQ